jgi:DNA-binding MarR family transcriptional regulator
MTFLEADHPKRLVAAGGVVVTGLAVSNVQGRSTCSRRRSPRSRAEAPTLRRPVRSSRAHADLVRTRAVEPRHLRYFDAAAEEPQCRKLAERLHVAQPAVSAQIRKLEQELGVTLFNRSRRGVALTPARTAFLEEAQHVLLAVAAGAGPALLPEVVTDRLAAPGIRFVAPETDEPALQSAVLTHPDTASLATLAFLRAIARMASSRAAQTPPAAVEPVA